MSYIVGEKYSILLKMYNEVCSDKASLKKQLEDKATQYDIAHIRMSRIKHWTPVLNGACHPLAHVRGKMTRCNKLFAFTSKSCLVCRSLALVWGNSSNGRLIITFGTLLSSFWRPFLVERKRT